MLQGKRVEISLNNTAALINSRFIQILVGDHIFLHLLKFTRYIFAKLEVTRAGRFSSYSIALGLVAYLVDAKVLSCADDLVKSIEPVQLVDEFCQKQWDYRLPLQVPFAWNCDSKQSAINIIIDHFTNFSSWLASQTEILDVRTGQSLDKKIFYEKYGMSDVTFKSGPINIVDPFEIEHNTTSQITQRSAFQVQKILKSIQIKTKMKRLIGKALGKFGLCVTF